MSGMQSIVQVQSKLDRERISTHSAETYQERASNIGLQLFYVAQDHRVDIKRYAALLYSAWTVGELRLFLLGYETARHQDEKELHEIVARLERNGINPMGEGR